MSFSLTLDDAQLAIQTTLRAFCRDLGAGPQSRIEWSADTWRALCALGIFDWVRGGAGLAPATDSATDSGVEESGEGGACELLAMAEVLGECAFPGPLHGTCLVVRAGCAGSGESIARGESVVSVGGCGVYPFATRAKQPSPLLYECEGAILHEVARVGALTEGVGLGGDPLGRCDSERAHTWRPSDDAWALCDIVRAAYLVGGSAKLIHDAGDHARTRKQFGRSIGEFQAVAHPLVQAHLRTEAARTLTIRAAAAFDGGAFADARNAAALARASASGAAVDTIHTAHQIFGAVGITLEGPIYHRTRRLRQTVGEWPALSDAHDLALLEVCSRSATRSASA